MTKSILSAYPNGKAPPEYLLHFAETLSYLTAQEVAWLTDPREGLVTRCQFLPTAADVFKLLNEKRYAAEQFKPAHTTYRRLSDEPRGPWDEETDYERKRRVVRECLGYNPGDTKDDKPRVFTEPTEADLKNLKLKTPPGPITPQLRALLEKEGWPFIPPQEQAA